MNDPIHYQLEKAGIRHICHYGEANSIGMFDLGDASTLCTECRISRGEITLADILLGRTDPMNREKIYEESARRYREERDLRISGKLPRHILYTAGPEGKHYERCDCKLERGSAGVTPERICIFCKQSVDG